MQNELADLARVATVGSGGAFATLALADVSVIVSIAVGVVTFCYVSAKLYFLLRNGGEK